MRDLGAPDASGPPPPPATLNELLDQTAARVPGRAALTTESGTWTYARLRERVLRAAAAFESRGVERGDCVALLLRNGPEFVVAYLALSRLGAVAVPLNFMVRKPEELRFMLGDCAAVGALTQRDFLPGLLAARRHLPGLRSVWSADGADPERGAEDFNAFLDAAPAAPAAAASVLGQDTACILYTSGTTGSPKGVLLSHANLTSNCEAALRLMDLSERDVFLCLLPMFHAFAWTACVLIPLRLGCRTAVASSIAPAKPWLRLMGRHGVTLFAAVPPVYAVLAKEARGLARLALRWWFFRRVRYCVSGAAPLSQKIASDFEDALGVPLFEGYGLTETSPVATINPPGRPKPGSVGLPIEGVRIKIVDEEERELPSGKEGEVCILGPNVMLGYHGHSQATAETFTRDGWFKSGDIGFLDQEGYLYLKDRKKDMIIIKGLKVFSAQVEAVLLAHPAVEEAAVIGIPDELGNERIKAFVVLKKDAETDKAALMRFFREKLDPYKRPRDVEIVESLPKNSMQKVLKRELRQRELEKGG